MTRILIEASLGKFLTEKIDKTHEWRNDHKYKWFDGAHRWLTVLADKFHPPQIPPAQFFSSKRFFFFWFYSCARSCVDCRQQRWSEDRRRRLALADVEVEGENYCWWKGGGGRRLREERETEMCAVWRQVNDCRMASRVAEPLFSFSTHPTANCRRNKRINKTRRPMTKDLVHQL